MEVDDDNKSNNDIWEWHEEEYCLQRDSRNEVSHCLWDEVNVNEENFMYMLGEPTPIKDCLDLDYQLSDVVGDNSNKGVEECTETSQMKRRRMLQFTSDNNIGIDKQQFASVREGSLREDVPSHNLEWGAQWNLGLHDGTGTAFNCEGWNQPPEGLLANCVNESEMHCSTNEMTDYIPSDNQVAISEFDNISSQMETDLVQNTPSPASIKIYKGRKSYLRTPKKLATPVAYPFALIKPCGVQGDVTLGDINQRIHAPPPSRLKHLKDNSSSPYLTSAFSGKPVVVKTKIRTEGGKGSITIMRTKG